MWYRCTCGSNDHKIIVCMETREPRGRYPDIQPEADHEQADSEQGKGFTHECVHGDAELTEARGWASGGKRSSDVIVEKNVRAC